jgi:UPF0755 protein
MMPNKRRRNSRRNIIPFFLLLLLVILAGAILWLGVPWLAEQQFGAASPTLSDSQKWSYAAQLLTQRNTLLGGACSASTPKDFTINPGDSVITISRDLQNSGIIQDADAFRSYLIYTGLDTLIRADAYQLDCALPAVEIARQIKNKYLENVVFSILPGWRAEEIAAALPSSGIEVSPADFLAVVHSPKNLNLPKFIPEGASLEGFLFPGEYTIKREISPSELVQIFMDRFNSEVGENIRSEIESQGLSVYQGVILASIVQRESYNDPERDKIASVFYNRLAQGINLETDPTVQYALGYSEQYGWWKSPLALSDLQVKSPYNTYLFDGLPPTPIANPDLSAILAVAKPAVTDYLFFRAVCDGSGTHVFARTFAEHVANECK